jgi:hypothetical protein
MAKSLEDVNFIVNSYLNTAALVVQKHNAETRQKYN